MNGMLYTPLQMREIFHLEFLRRLGRKLGAEDYCLKGGINLRFFFDSIRYSEDMDIDIQRVRVEKIKKTVLEILSDRSLLDSLKTFGIERVVPPNILKAKQTETTQRFKIHLLTSSGEDLFTKIEFSRRGWRGAPVVEPVSAAILRSYKMSPLLIAHYDVVSAAEQKIQALAQRAVLQARDVFDLFLLSSRYNTAQQKKFRVNKVLLEKAYANIFLLDFPQFRDTVVAYLTAEDQRMYSSPAVWDEIKLKTCHFLDELKNEGTPST